MKVLIAVDTSEASQKAVRFAKKLLGPHTEITVFHVAEMLPAFIVTKSTSPLPGEVYQSVARDWAEEHRAQGEKLLSQCRNELQAPGIPESAIRTVLLQRESRPEAARTSATQAIIEEMKKGNYDAVILGRRGNSDSNETLIGTVAERVAREASHTTVCIVD